MKQNKNKTEKQKIGEIGENIAVKHLVKQGYNILDRNFRKPWGEIDIVAKKDDILYFVEVKTVSYETVSYETNKLNSDYDPENNVDDWKIKRLNKAIQSYLGYIKSSDKQEWQINIMSVFVDLKNKKAKIRITEDI
ncbi:MAG: YraN family protein [Candidatus Niyogibacteria bacterium]|nr:YraN family protein [Candidatus Niyogibacteria bacterium]